MNNSYILARWRDAITDPPIEEWMGNLRVCGGNAQFPGRIRNGWAVPMSPAHAAYAIQPGDQWLDITTVPGVPREAVQAAVDEIKRIRTQTVYGYQATGLDIALDELRNHTGVTPSEVTHD